MKTETNPLSVLAPLVTITELADSETDDLGRRQVRGRRVELARRRPVDLVPGASEPVSDPAGNELFAGLGLAVAVNLVFADVADATKLSPTLNVV